MSLYKRQLKTLLKSTLYFTDKHPNIIFTRADKGNVTVALDKNFYITEIEKVLHDNNTYVKIKKNPISSIEKTLNNTLKRWFENEYIKKIDLFRFRSSNSLFPKAYGLPKIHKEKLSFRIIVSSHS